LIKEPFFLEPGINKLPLLFIYWADRRKLT
jgi:hypothetical protein